MKILVSSCSNILNNFQNRKTIMNNFNDESQFKNSDYYCWGNLGELME